MCLVKGLLFDGEAEEGRTPAEELSCEWDGGSVRRGRPRTDALRQKSARVLGDGGSDRRGRPRTAALRQKSARVLGMETSDRRGRRSTEVLRKQACAMWRANAYRTSTKKLHRAVRVRPLQTHARTLGVAQVSSFLEEEPTRCGCRYRRSTCAKRSKQMSISSLS